jgi:hypothetical protein
VWGASPSKTKRYPDNPVGASRVRDDRPEGTATLAKRPRYSRWRRLPGLYRFGEKNRPEPKLEPQRLTLYLGWDLLDAAEAQAAQAGVQTIQEYCTRLLQQAIETERVRAQVASIEAQRGLLEGLQEIADDPEYLAEWSAQIRAQAQARNRPAAEPLRVEPPAHSTAMPAPGAVDAHAPDDPSEPRPGHESGADVAPGPIANAPDLSPSALVVLRHAALLVDNGPSFLASLRRGEAVPVAAVAELARALQDLEDEARDASSLDRRLAYALHRLAFEGQVLHTDAWPGAFDAWTVDTLRAVQEAADRILSGQDIRYESPTPGSGL